ncbi:T6SS effector phospholipase Tle3 domain-containing protein [Xanthomonas oryzae pv. oryzicola]|uniref:T6SS effector phospholipase Tle3 domain-containing protein n=1 Tax=Xanthomonas oryzae TaxID=347 RepID=UPI003D176190
MTDSCSYVVAQANALLLPNRMGERLVEVPADRPGIVIFIHGVNDPGAAYPTVEKGLCQGLNERLSRIDLRAGHYGAKYAEAKKSPLKPGEHGYKEVASVKYDPDTYLYQRSEDTTSKLPTHSMFIPFYWGYRASNNEIAKDKRGNPTRLRSQYQDTAGNRLDANFAKAGGFFVNATSNLPDMYGKGFEKTLKTRGVQMVSPDFTYFGNAPPRRYFVLAAERLAMLVSEIRRLAPDDTITIMGHSQGTMITLLAQAMLAERSQRCLADPSQRCADCLILVDSPYSLLEPEGEEQTSQAKLRTLINIVNAVTTQPHARPALSELQVGAPGYGGRTGHGWTPSQGTRLDAEGKQIVFAERDNRGKVYLYFCPQDTTVALDQVQGIGTYGVPDTVHVAWKRKFYSAERTATLPAMDALKDMRFHQRMWTKLLRGGKPVAVGLPPRHIPLRMEDEARYPGGGVAPATTLSQTPLPQEGRYVNGEALQPPHAPHMEEGEADARQYGSSTSLRGTPTRAGKDAPDDVSVDVALGNPEASLGQYMVTERFSPGELHASELQELTDRFNAQHPDINDQTPGYICNGSREMGYIVQRYATPNEVRAQMTHNPAALVDNSYHSAMLRSTENHRWVTAMDVAIGQAQTLDDPEWRKVLIAFANWRTPFAPPKYQTASSVYISELANFKKLSPGARKLVEASCLYYEKGVFPAGLVSSSPPAKYVESRTRAQRAESNE